MSAEELIRVCETGAPEAWEEFVSRFHRSISLTVVRTARIWGEMSAQAVDDLVQETYLKLCTDKCRLLSEFASHHPDAILGYIKTTAANVVHDHFKSLRATKRGSGKPPDSLETAELFAVSKAAGSVEAIEREVLLSEIGHCLHLCSAGPEQERDCMIFWLYYRQGMSAQAIASMPGVGLSAKGVESAIFRMTRLVRRHIVELRVANTRTPLKEKGLGTAESY